MSGERNPTYSNGASSGNDSPKPLSDRATTEALRRAGTGLPDAVLNALVFEPAATLLPDRVNSWIEQSLIGESALPIEQLREALSLGSIRDPATLSYCELIRERAEDLKEFVRIKLLEAISDSSDGALVARAFCSHELGRTRPTPDAPVDLALVFEPRDQAGRPIGITIQRDGTWLIAPIDEGASCLLVSYSISKEEVLVRTCVSEDAFARMLTPLLNAPLLAETQSRLLNHRITEALRQIGIDPDFVAIERQRISFFGGSKSSPDSAKLEIISDIGPGSITIHRHSGSGELSVTAVRSPL